MHPVETIRGVTSTRLKGRRIVLGITGSIAAVQCFELSRELIRHGAEVIVVMSHEAQKIVTPYTMEFATGAPPITEIGGAVEHVDLCGDNPERVDLLLIAPCTANTISKMALAIDDTPVTTMVTTALGTGIPIIVVPAMHGSMYRHPILQKNIRTLTEIGAEFVGPHIQEGKAKMASVQEIVARVLRTLGRGDLKGKRALIIGGSSEEPIDGMRVITNRGTGETAVELALAAFERGADVELWMGRHQTHLPDFIQTKHFRRLEDLREKIGTIDHDVVLVPAALSDYSPETTEGKIPSDREVLVLPLRSLPKLLPQLRGGPFTLVGFKAEHGIGDDELERRARSRMEEYGLDLIVANDLTRVKKGETEVLMISRLGEVVRAGGSKREVSDSILDEVLKVMS